MNLRDDAKCGIFIFPTNYINTDLMWPTGAETQQQAYDQMESVTIYIQWVEEEEAAVEEEEEETVALQWSHLYSRLLDYPNLTNPAKGH